MTGLSVLYAKEAAEEREWAAIPDRDRPGRLREVYWARRAESESGRQAFLSMKLYWRPNRREIGRGRDDPGDGFIYLVNMMPPVEDRFEWLEVTEVFTTVPASQIEGAMRAWNGIPDKHPVDHGAFLRGLPRGRPTRVEQRRAADEVIARIEKKLAKGSYHELLEKYGYGTLVVGMPLWFAVPPDDPFRAENSLDDFMTRTALGLKDIQRSTLRRRDCPFRSVVITWDTTPQAWRTWRETRSVAYEDAANASVESPTGVEAWGGLADALEEAVSRTAIPESEAPSVSLQSAVTTRKKASGKGPYPELVEALGEVVRARRDEPMSLKARLRWRITATLLRLLCFVRIHGVEGLLRWIARKFSVSRAWRARETQRRARRFYMESATSRRRAPGLRPGVVAILARGNVAVAPGQGGVAVSRLTPHVPARALRVGLSEREASGGGQTVGGRAGGAPRPGGHVARVHCLMCCGWS